eukprot:UN26984
MVSRRFCEFLMNLFLNFSLQNIQFIFLSFFRLQNIQFMFFLSFFKLAKITFMFFEFFCFFRIFVLTAGDIPQILLLLGHFVTKKVLIENCDIF